MKVLIQETTKATTNTLVVAKEKAIAVEMLFAKHAIQIAAQSYLAELIAAAKEVSDASLMAHEVTCSRFFEAVLLDRVADAVLLLDGLPEAKSYLERLRSGKLRLLSREATDEKNILWELELLFMLRFVGLKAKLQEPPDIVAQMRTTQIGIACKKTYSEKGVSKAVSDGVSQIEGSFEHGIIALSLDDLVPDNSILRARTSKEASNILAAMNQRFLAEHQRHFRRYLKPDRLISVLVSTAALVELTEERPQFSNMRQTAFWSFPDSKGDTSGLLKEFREKILVECSD